MKFCYGNYILQNTCFLEPVLCKNKLAIALAYTKLRSAVIIWIVKLSDMFRIVLQSLEKNFVFIHQLAIEIFKILANLGKSLAIKSWLWFINSLKTWWFIFILQYDKIKCSISTHCYSVVAKHSTSVLVKILLPASLPHFIIGNYTQRAKISLILTLINGPEWVFIRNFYN